MVDSVRNLYVAFFPSDFALCRLRFTTHIHMQRRAHVREHVLAHADGEGQRESSILQNQLFGILNATNELAGVVRVTGTELEVTRREFLCSFIRPLVRHSNEAALRACICERTEKSLRVRSIAEQSS